MKKLLAFLFACTIFAGCGDDTQTEPVETDTTPHLNKNDSLALINIYNAIGPWRTDWDFNDITTWNGVATALDLATNELRVVGFEIYGGRFHGALPEDFCQLTELRRLVITGGTMGGHIPEDIGNLKQLECLAIADNNISGGIPKSIGELTKLQHLDFRNTKLCDTIPESIGNLANLEYMVISNTQMTGNIPKSIANMKKLRTVWLNQNHFSGTFPVEILRSDVLFECADNDIEELPFEVWKDDNGLFPPVLRNNRLSGVIPEWVKQTEKWNENASMCISIQQKGYGYSNYSHH